MSDLNDLIHTNAVIAFQQGEQREHERIIKLLEDNCNCFEECYCTLNKVFALIKGEQK